MGLRMLHWCLTVASVLFASGSLYAQSLTWLTLGGAHSVARGVSADGTVVVGEAINAGGSWRAFRWANGVMQDLGTLGGYHSYAYGVSADGNVVVGWSYSITDDKIAFRWTSGGGMQDVNPFDSSLSYAYGVSSDGRVVVGGAYNVDGYVSAFRLAGDTAQDLGTLGGDESSAYGSSSDGSVVVGGSQNANGDEHAFRWTTGGGMQDLGTLDGRWSRALGVSPDGRVVVGSASDASDTLHAFRWTTGGGMQDLGALKGGYWSEAYGVCADGSVVVGMAYDASGHPCAFRWTLSGGMEDLNQTYASLLTDGSNLVEAFAISPDGRYIVGRGNNAATRREEAFLLDTGVSLSRIRGNIVLNDFDGDVSQVPVQVELRGDTTRTLTIYPEANGDYTISDVQPGTYNVAFKGSHWLRVVVPDVQVSGAEVTGIDVALTNGDIDGDNEVTLFDFGTLVQAFGSMPGDSNWNPNADLDGDNEVTLFDFGVLVRNFGAIGED